MYEYIKSEPRLWTVGFYDPKGKWQAESDHEDTESATARVHYLNGGNSKTNTAQQNRIDVLEGKLAAINGAADEVIVGLLPFIRNPAVDALTFIRAESAPDGAPAEKTANVQIEVYPMIELLISAMTVLRARRGEITSIPRAGLDYLLEISDGNPEQGVAGAIRQMLGEVKHD